MKEKILSVVFWMAALTAFYVWGHHNGYQRGLRDAVDAIYNNPQVISQPLDNQVKL